MSTLPRLSIGLPVYNGERFLAESIEAPAWSELRRFRVDHLGQRFDDDTPGNGSTRPQCVTYFSASVSSQNEVGVVRPHGCNGSSCVRYVLRYTIPPPKAASERGACCGCEFQSHCRD